MVEHLDVDAPLSRALGRTEWLAADWLLHDISTHLRSLTAMTFNVHRPKGSPPLELHELPYPSTGTVEISEEQAAAEAELLEHLHSGG